MKIQENISLAPYTTFKIGGPARFFCIVTNEAELIEAVSFAQKQKVSFFTLGGGSNILISDKGFSGLVIKVEIEGIKYGKVVSVGAGEMWDDIVSQTVGRGLFGLENLSAIPGTVGAVPVQNIGAYGADVSRVVASVRAFDTTTMKYVELSNADCQFGYRDSLFKHEKGRYVITRVDFNLSKNGKVNLKYKDLEEYFKNKKEKPSLQEVRDAVIDIRWNKLPDWQLWGTAGSFFKNPTIPVGRFNELKKQYPDMPGFPDAQGKVKLPLGWILDKVCNAKELSGKARVYEKQALVVIAEPGATAGEVVALTQELMKRVKEKTGIEIEGEVEWVN